MTTPQSEEKLNNNKGVVTRFAPSPTGNLHIGGARTALFNYLFAKANGGKFLLRVEDTDVKRSTVEAKNAIINGLNWIGLNHDDEIVYQSERKQSHIEAVNKMLQNGSAYYAYDTAEELENQREEARANKTQYLYNPKWRDETLPKPEGVKPVVRLKIPEGKTIITDMVHAEVVFENETLEDLVLMRADGTPTYMLSVVVDDMEMGVTHIIRGDDHLSNTPKQAIIYKYLLDDGKKMPQFAHIPLIHNIQGQKLSKRKGAASVEEFDEMGYLPEAVMDYLMHLGWSPRCEGEFLTTEEAIKIFNVSQIGKSPSRFDFDKLNNTNLHYISKLNDEDIIEKVVSRLPKYKNIGDKCECTTQDAEKLIATMLTELKNCHTLNEMCTVCALFIGNNVAIDESDIAKLKEESNIEIAESVKNFMLTEGENGADYSDFQASFKAFLANNAAKGYTFKKVGPLLRLIIIGESDFMSLSRIVEILGKEMCIQRIKNTWSEFFEGEELRKENQSKPSDADIEKWNEMKPAYGKYATEPKDKKRYRQDDSGKVIRFSSFKGTSPMHWGEKN